MHRPSLLLALLLAALVPARAETPAEQASRQLEQGVQRDRAAEAGAAATGRDAGALTVEPTPTTRALEADRRSLEPDVGRPEAQGSSIIGGDRGATSGSRNPQR